LYDWLLDYQKLKEEIEYLEYKIEREKQELKRWVYGDLQDVKLQEDSIASGLEERIEAYEKELQHKKNDLKKAEELIRTFQGLDNKILYYKYVKGMTLEEIANELNYSESHIRKKHAELVRTIKYLKMYHSCSLIK